MHLRARALLTFRPAGRAAAGDRDLSLPSVQCESEAALGGRDHGGGVLSRVRGQGGGVGPDKLGVLVPLGAGRLAVPPAGREREPDPGVGSSRVALVNRQDMAELRRVEGNPYLLEGLADSGLRDVLSPLQVP